MKSRAADVMCEVVSNGLRTDSSHVLDDGRRKRGLCRVNLLGSLWEFEEQRLDVRSKPHNDGFVRRERRWQTGAGAGKNRQQEKGSQWNTPFAVALSSLRGTITERIGTPGRPHFCIRLAEYGDSVSFEDSPRSVKTEFGFDVL